MKINKKRFGFSSIFTLILLLFIVLGTSGCQKQPWTTRTPFNVGIVGDVDRATQTCANGTIVTGENGQLFCQTETRWNEGIVGDRENADRECDGVLLVGPAGYFECWVDD